MKTIVSVSLGSASRDHRAKVELLGEQFDISREGMDGSIDRALKRLRQLDGTVDAIGLGGIDVYLYGGTERVVCVEGWCAAAKCGEDGAGGPCERVDDPART